MTIPVDCPHCETRFQLQPDTVGKPTRCPVCKEFFVVAPADEPLPAPKPAPAPRQPARAERPYERVESGAPVAPIFEDEPRPAPRPPAVKAPAQPAGGPREVVWWDESAAPPAPADDAPVRATRQMRAEHAAGGSDDGDDADFIRRRPARRSYGQYVAGGLALGVVGLLAAGVFGVFRAGELREDRAAEAAQLAYDDGQFPQASEQFAKLAEAFPASPQLERYRFLAALAQLQQTASAPGLADDPAPAEQSFTKFLADHGESALAKPGEGFGGDVVSAGKKVADAVADSTATRLKRFQADRTKLGELGAVESRTAELKRLIPAVEKFRGPQSADLASVSAKAGELEALAAKERHRLEVLAPYRDLDRDPTAPKIEAFEAVLANEKLAQDAEALGMVASAEKRLRELVRAEVKGTAAQAAPVEMYPPILLNAPLSLAPPETYLPFPADTLQSGGGRAVFAVDRGIATALDARTGEALWGARVGPPTATGSRRSADVPVPLTLGEMPAALVASEFGLTARDARTGEAVWHQAFPEGIAGAPVVVGGRVYVPLKDEMGTVAELDAVGGTYLASLRVRQPLGAGLTTMPVSATGHAGHELLFIPGDTKRVFVFETGREDDAGSRLLPRCLAVLLTDHPRDSLLGEALAITPAIEGAPRYLVLPQSDGPTAMKLRAFPLPSPAEMIKSAAGGAVESRPVAGEVPVPGHSWFPGATDGERVAFATDAGAVYVFGVNQVGQADAPLFTLPGPRPSAEQEDVRRAQVVRADEDTVHAVLGGQLVRLRTAIDPAQGLRLVVQGAGREVGEPAHRAQLLPELGLAVVVTRSTSGTQAIGFDLASGRLRWQRRVGLTPAGAPVLLAGQVHLAGDDGSVYKLSGGRAEVVAAPDLSSVGATQTAVDARAKTFAAMSVDQAANRRQLRVRLVAPSGYTERTLAMPDTLAGNPVLVGTTVYLPLANGYIYRLRETDTAPQNGPLWRGDTAPDAAKPGEVVCHLGAAPGGDLLASDGGRRVYRWAWPDESASATVRGEPVELNELVALPAVELEQDRVAVADRAGGVSVFTGTKLARRVPAPPELASAGAPTGRLLLAGPAGGRVVVVTLGNRHLVGIDPAELKVAWSRADLAPPDKGQLVGVIGSGPDLVVAPAEGAPLTLDGRTGRTLPGAELPPGLPVLLSAPQPLGDGPGLAVAADGAAVLVPLGAGK